MPDVAMPRLSDSMEEGTILRWLKSDGDEVSRGDELVEIETDKANMTYEADQDGVLEIVASEGDTLEIGETIARIGEGSSSNGASASEEDDEDEDDSEEGSGEEDEESDSGEDDAGEEEDSGDEENAGDDEGDTAEDDDSAEGEPSGEEEDEERGEAAVEDSGDGEEQPSGSADGDGDGRIKASPVAKRVAGEHDIELSGLEGSGPGGRIVKADVEAARDRGETGRGEERSEEGESKREPSERGTAKGDVETQELTRTQQVVARRMAEAKATVPEFTLTAEIDMARAVEARADLKATITDEDHPVPSFNDFIIKACALALREFPRANAAYKDGTWELYSRVNVGMAVAAEGTLIVPTIFDADTRPLGDIARLTRELAQKVRDGKVSPPELSGGTFTVSNLGMFGVTNFTAIINPPQAATLAIGAIREVPVVRDGEIVPGHTMAVTLASDHRVLYGADSARFLARIVELLEHPVGLAL